MGTQMTPVLEGTCLLRFCDALTDRIKLPGGYYSYAQPWIEKATCMDTANNRSNVLLIAP